MRREAHVSKSIKMFGKSDKDGKSERDSKDFITYEGKSFNRRLTSHAILSNEEEQELTKAYFENKDPEAREQLIIHNQRLVAYIASNYKRSNVEYDDLVQEGNIGLMRAIETFDYRKGNKFSTYATWWIWQAMSRSAQNDRGTIRIPVHMYEEISTMQKKSAEFEQKYGREPSTEELCEMLNTTANKVFNLKRAQSMTSITSLSTPIGDDNGCELQDIISDNKTVVDIFDEEEKRNALTEALNKLTERERIVIVERYGLNGNDPKTLNVVGEEMGITRERVRQIQNQAIAKLKKNKNLKEFTSVVNG